MRPLSRTPGTRMQRLLTLFALAATAAVLGRVTPPAAAAAAKRPNILVIMTDDQSHDTLTQQFMPRTLAGIANEGVLFTQGFDTTALCCPSRSSFLTGRYARHHGVHVNQDRLSGTTIAERLHDAGYHTGLIGKYLNSWKGDARPEFDDWAAWITGYTDAKMNVRGTFQTVPGYQTYVLRDFALQFLREAPQDKPFFLLFTPHAPHTPSTPAPRDADAYADLPRWRPPNFNPAELPGAPRWLQQQFPVLTREQVRDDVDEIRRRQLACLKSVDEAVGDLLELLRQQGRLDDTFVVFYSDNGYFWGEHRIARQKNRVYEEAHHVPFAVRYPPLAAGPRVDASLVANIDLAPTMCDLAGIPVPADMDGRSLVPLLSDGGAAWRDALLLEGWPEEVPYQALRTDHSVYVENTSDLPELYDLATDPYQMSNLADDPAHATDVETLRRRLRSGTY
jgi:arylsulfatase A-like enzyme